MMRPAIGPVYVYEKKSDYICKFNASMMAANECANTLKSQSIQADTRPSDVLAKGRCYVRAFKYL